jgi:hypothetical protein
LEIFASSIGGLLEEIAGGCYGLPEEEDALLIETRDIEEEPGERDKLEAATAWVNRGIKSRSRCGSDPSRARNETLSVGDWPHEDCLRAALFGSKRCKPMPFTTS